MYLSPTSDPLQHWLWVPLSWMITVLHNVCFMKELGKANTHALLPPVQVHNAVAPPIVTAGVMDDTLVEGSNTTLNLDVSCSDHMPVDLPTMSPILTANEHDDESRT